MIDADQVRALRQAYWANGFRPVAVWLPGACDITGQPVRGAGKRPQGDDWRERALRDPPDAVARSVSNLALITGILTSPIAGIDVDVLAPWLAEAVVHRAPSREAVDAGNVPAGRQQGAGRGLGRGPAIHLRWSSPRYRPALPLDCNKT
jgi:hypothetical protein